ncbi:MAG: NTP transferase domain-containing protein [bacterium]
MMIGAIVQARISSQRLPGKVLCKLNGKPLLGYVLERLERCCSVDKIIVATSTDERDAPIVDFCKECGCLCFRGSLEDVASRLKEVLNRYQFDGFVRISGDSPLLDQRLVDQAIKIFQQCNFEIVTNVFKRTYPKGQSVEVLDSKTFIRGYELMRNLQDLEHSTPFFYRNCKDFKIFNFSSNNDYSGIQLSVDTTEDLKVIASIIKCMDKPHWQYDLEDILKIYQEVSKTLEVGHGK